MHDTSLHGALLDDTEQSRRFLTHGVRISLHVLRFFYLFIHGVLFLASLEVLSLIKTLMATYCPLLECASPKLMRTFASSPFDVTYLG